MLHGLLKFDPMKVPARGVPGFGAGSGAPSVMFGFLKHLWYTGDKSQALLRCAAPPCARGTSAAAAGARAQPPRHASRATPGASRTAVSGGIFLEKDPLNFHALPWSSVASSRSLGPLPESQCESAAARQDMQGGGSAGV